MKKLFLAAVTALYASAACAASDSADLHIAPAYRDVLDGYKSALSEAWTYSQLERAGLCDIALIEHMYTADAGEKLAWGTIDADGDGIDELIVAPADGWVLYDMYTLSGIDSVKLLRPHPRDAWRLTRGEDGGVLLENEADISTARSGTFWYELRDGRLRMAGGVICDHKADAREPYYEVGADWSREEWDVSKARHVTAVDAKRKLAEHSERRFSPPLAKMSTYR